MKIFTAILSFFVIFAFQKITEGQTSKSSWLPASYADYEKTVGEAINSIVTRKSKTAGVKIEVKIKLTKQASINSKDYLVVIAKLEDEYGNFSEDYALLFKKQGEKIEWLKILEHDGLTGENMGYEKVEFVDITGDKIAELVFISSGDYLGDINIIDLANEKQVTSWKKRKPLKKESCEFFELKNKEIIIEDSECGGNNEVYRTTRYHWDEKQKAMVPVK